MLFNYQTYIVVKALEGYLEEFKNQVDLVGYADYDHFFNIYEVLSRMTPDSRPATIQLDSSELNALEEFL